MPRRAHGVSQLTRAGTPHLVWSRRLQHREPVLGLRRSAGCDPPSAGDLVQRARSHESGQKLPGEPRRFAFGRREICIPCSAPAGSYDRLSGDLWLSLELPSVGLSDSEAGSGAEEEFLVRDEGAGVCDSPGPGVRVGLGSDVRDGCTLRVTDRVGEDPSMEPPPLHEVTSISTVMPTTAVRTIARSPGRSFRRARGRRLR
jgi:hypothetical protein